MKLARHTLTTLVLILGALPTTVGAQGASTDLGQATLEDLMNIRVTSAARRSQRVEDVPAAVYVITAGDIRRSGFSTLPEILRLAPGVQVARISGSSWAVSIRGFNGLYSNKLLVLVDGRSVYSRTFSGVFWDLQDLLISDIDRIEIIRGPGGAVWGANAVNGVINIISRAATETQGLSVQVSAGTFERERGAIRYGGTAAGAAYRVFTKWTRHADSDPSSTIPYSDRWQSLTSGFRIDSSRGPDAFLAQGHVTVNRTRPGWAMFDGPVPGVSPSTDGISKNEEASALGRWTRRGINGTSYQLQAYHTFTRRDESIIAFSEQTTDIDTQYETRLGLRHGVVFGGGYRYVDLSTDDSFTLQIGSHQTRTASAFLQDEISLRRDLALTAGARVEHDTFGGWGVLPSVRLMWDVSPGQRVWAAASRARRTPSVIDRSLRVVAGVAEGPGLPIVFGFAGNPAYLAEHLTQAETGYRTRIGSKASVEATAFVGSYDHLPSQEPIAPDVQFTPAPGYVFMGSRFENLLSARANGLELNTHWTPTERVEIDASYSFLRVVADAEPASQDSDPGDIADGAPAHQWQVRSNVTLWPGFEIGAAAHHVSRLRGLDVPAHTRVDATAETALRDGLTLSLVAQNLLNRRHQEFPASVVSLASRVPRALRLDIRWAF